MKKLLLGGIYLLFLESVLFAENPLDIKDVLYQGSTSGEKILKIEVECVSKCFFGDLDALTLEIEKSKGSLALQLSVEALPLNSNRVYYGVPNENLDTSRKNSLGSYTVTLPKKEGSNAFMVLLCTVDSKSQEKRPCSAQSLIAMNDVFLPYRVDSSVLNATSSKILKPEAYHSLPKPKVLYAQLFFAGEAMIGATRTLIEKDNLETALSSFGVSQKESRRIYQEFSRFDQALGSLPLEIDKGEMTIPLPYYDEIRCNGSRE